MGLSARNAVLAICGIGVFLTACGADDDPAGNEASSIAVRGCSPENPLIPARTTESCGGQVIDQIFSKLIRYDPETAEPVYEIAESIESEDNQTWRITLKDGWTFHNGEPITAQSFVDAWNWTAYAPNGAANSTFFKAIEGYEDLQPKKAEDAEQAPPEYENSAGAVSPSDVPEKEMSGLRVIDELTFSVTLSQPESSFPLRVGYAAFAPLPKEFFEDPDAFGKNPIGSGPFEFAEWVQGSEVKLNKYDGYQGETQPAFDEVIFKIYQDDTAAYSDLQADNLDIMPSLPSSALADEAYKSDLGDRFVEKEALLVSTLTFAPDSVDPSVADERLRRAISMAIDRDAIVDSIFHGNREPATGWVAPGVEGFQPDACGEYCTYQPEQAQELLAEAGGYDGTLTLTYNTDGENKPWVDAVCHSISNTLDITCRGVPISDFSTLRSEINAREISGMFTRVWQADYPSVESFLGPVFSTGASSNDGDYSNSDFDDLITDAASLHGDDAIAKYNEAERVLAEDMPAIPLWYSTAVAGYSTKVDNVKITPFLTVDLLSVTAG